LYLGFRIDLADPEGWQLEDLHEDRVVHDGSLGVGVRDIDPSLTTITFEGVHLRLDFLAERAKPKMVGPIELDGQLLDHVLDLELRNGWSWYIIVGLEGIVDYTVVECGILIALECVVDGDCWHIN
jgi:hypothetical protein